MNPKTDIAYSHDLNLLLNQVLKSYCRKAQDYVPHFGGKQFLWGDEQTIRVTVNKQNIEIFGNSHDGERVRNLHVSAKVETVNNQARIEFIERLLSLYWMLIAKQQTEEMYVIDLVYHWEQMRNKMLHLLSKVFTDKLTFSVEYDDAKSTMSICMFNNAGTRRLLITPVTPKKRKFT